MFGTFFRSKNSAKVIAIYQEQRSQNCAKCSFYCSILTKNSMKPGLRLKVCGFFSGMLGGNDRYSNT